MASMSLKMLTPSLACKIITVPMALCGVALTSDVLHGKVSEEFEKQFGFGSWFPPLVGLWEGAIGALIWYEGGAYQSLAMKMLAVVMGGVCYAHAALEGNVGGCVVPVVFGALSVVVLLDKDPASTPVDVAKVQAGFALLGVVVGLVVSALSPGKPKEKK